MLVRFARPESVARELHRGIPQRTRAQKLTAVIADLPIKSGKRIGEARIDRGLREH
jgi:hypothetical protein